MRIIWFTDGPPCVGAIHTGQHGTAMPSGAVHPNTYPGVADVARHICPRRWGTRLPDRLAWRYAPRAVRDDSRDCGAISHTRGGTVPARNSDSLGLSAGRRDRAAPEQRQLGLARAQRRLGAGQARRDRIPALLQLVKDRGFREAIGLTPPFAGPAKQVPASPQHGWPAELNPRA